ncbi:TRAP transporter substrate-binding protein [Rhodoferax sp. AJA081-3]|uniref:TRAP transporter substrate-binding protein n=1 Tax=Rhodoferax sp. AJA081-3 TaxID=2752316 RepID=UPI001ADF5811|nr:TRAP transporter substrate-binding protein [Rhodoferax sp. AJA081-3]QTN29683.1 TRAP transporter substrate-binding protein [Rhodoferax sp. AJA081-3]
MKKLAFIIACASTLAAPLAFGQTKWDLPTGYATNTFQTENVQQFADDVAKATGGKLKITVHAGASLYKMPEIKRAVQSGQTQAGEFILSAYANENPIFGVDSVPFLATSYGAAQRLYVAAKPATEKLLESQGMKLLFSVPWPGQSLYSIKPITKMSDFAGTKMRAYNPATTKIAQLVKAQPVTIQLAELGQALATGAVDNFLTSSASGIDSKLYEQTKFFYIVNAWLPRNATVVNKKAFDALDKATQDAVIAAGKAAEVRGWEASKAKDFAYVKELGKNGMTTGLATDEVRDGLGAIGDTMVKEWMAAAGPDGIAIIEAYKKR